MLVCGWASVGTGAAVVAAVPAFTMIVPDGELVDPMLASSYCMTEEMGKSRKQQEKLVAGRELGATLIPGADIPSYLRSKVGAACVYHGIPSK